MSTSSPNSEEIFELNAEDNLAAHPQRLQHILTTQWRNGQFCDLHIKLTDGTIDVHACVFFGYCPNLIDAIGLDCFDASSKEVNLVSHQITEIGMRSIVRYFYTGCLELPPDRITIQEVHKTAKLFGLKHFLTICEDLSVTFVDENSPSPPKVQAAQSRKRGRLRRKSSPRKIKAEVIQCPKVHIASDTWIADVKTERDHSDEEWLPPSVRKRPTRSSNSKTVASIKSMLKLEDDLINIDQVDDLECDENEFKCFNCSKIFESLSEIESHLKSCTATDSKLSDTQTDTKVECDICGRAFARQCNLTVHKRREHTGRCYLQCIVCEFKASSENELRAHCKQEHDILKPFRCDFPGCDYKARKYEFVHRHKPIHQELFDHFCENCGRAFAQLGGLISHRRACYASQAYLCDICGKAFNHPQSMKTHRRAKHFNEKPYSCSVCNACFSDHRNFKRHKRIHENAYPYCCEVCGKRYRHSNSLKAHMLKHIESPEKDCEKYFKSAVFYTDELEAAAESLMLPGLPEVHQPDRVLETSSFASPSLSSDLTSITSMVATVSTPTSNIMSEKA